MEYPGIPPKPFDNPTPLFNLAEDPAERVDLAEAHPEIVERLTGEYLRYLDSMPDVK